MQIAGPYTVTIGAYPDTDAEIETSRIDGRIVGVGIAVHSNTGNISITTKGDSQTPAQTILTKNSVGTDAWFYPRQAIQKNDGSSITAQYDHGTPVCDLLVIAVSSASDGDVFDFTFMVE